MEKWTVLEDLLEVIPHWPELDERTRLEWRTFPVGDFVELVNELGNVKVLRVLVDVLAVP